MQSIAKDLVAVVACGKVDGARWRKIDVVCARRRELLQVCGIFGDKVSVRSRETTDEVSKTHFSYVHSPYRTAFCSTLGSSLNSVDVSVLDLVHSFGHLDLESTSETTEDGATKHC